MNSSRSLIIAVLSLNSILPKPDVSTMSMC